jgi:hypothetical protein
VESGGSSIGKVGECDMASRHLQGCSPHLCRLRIDGLPHASKYGMYRSHTGDICPISLVTYRQHTLGLSTPLQWLCWKRNWGGSRGPLNRAERWSWEHFFLRAVHLSNPIDNSWKVSIGGPREIRMIEGHTWTECRKRVACWSNFPLQGVHQFESSRLSDMSNQLFVAIFM